MRLELTASVLGLTVARIFDVPKLDPINLVLRDDGGCGQVIAECYGHAWATYFGSIGERTLPVFIAGVHPEYLSGRFEVPTRQGVRVTKAVKATDDDYRLRVCNAVVEACKRLLIDAEARVVRS